MKTKYMVLGLWHDDYGQFADSVEADSPEDAVAQILEQYTGEDSDAPGACLMISGVCTIIDGEIAVVY